MSLKPIKLWRNTPPLIGGQSPSDTVAHLFPSGRQALTEAVRILGGSRKTYWGIPEYSSSCVISAISRFTNPVPYRAASERIPLSGILIYDQWGWQKPASYRTDILQRFPNARLIWDRVDTLCPSLSDYLTETSDCQVLSLSKTLGTLGGGMLSQLAKWYKPPVPPESASTLSSQLNRLLSSPSLGTSDQETLRIVFKEHLLQRPEPLLQWCQTNSLETALRSEWQHRKQAVTLLASSPAIEAYPEWMRTAAQGPALPGIFPIFSPSIGEAQRGAIAIQNSYNVEAVAYHFNVSIDFTDPAWQPCIAIPVHGEMPLDLLDQILSRSE